VVCPLLLILAGCGRYGDFTLPVFDGSAPAPVTLNLQPAPVMSFGASGEWDSSDVLNPSVLFHDQQFWNFYSGSGRDRNVWRTGLATSPDGIAWTRRGLILSPDAAGWDRGYIAGNGSALWRNGEFLYWYQAGNHGGVMRIGLARSADGLHFRKEPKPVLDIGPYQSWDERAVADPYVVEAHGWLYLYYLGQDRAARQRIGVARSRDGISWEKLRANPIVGITAPGIGGMDENGAGEPAVFVWKGHYWMLLTGRDAHEHRRLAALWSNDGVHWTRQAGTFSGDQPWDSTVVCDPTVLVDSTGVRLWFGGGDSASPDEGLHGQIGTGTMQ
jgi:sucrose-6-phosphate hydrolase SacC (GH32 family)